MSSFVDRIKHRNMIKKLQKTKNSNGDYISYIINHELDLEDPEIVNFIIEAIRDDKITDYQLEELMENPKFDKILYTGNIMQKVIELFATKIKKLFEYSHRIDSKYLREILDNEELKSRLLSMIDVKSLGDELLNNIMRGIENNDYTKDKIALLRELGYEINDDVIFNIIVNYDGAYRSSIYYKLGAFDLITPNVVDRLYQHKFELLKKWCKSDEEEPPTFEIDEDLEPSPDNAFANYWRSMDIATGEDTLTLVVTRIKNYAKDNDAFGEVSIERLYQIWQEENRYYKKTKEDFTRDIEKNTGRLFNELGLPTDLLFSDYYKLHFLRKILYYNYEDRIDPQMDIPLIKFLIANIDRIPKEYRFIFVKLNELRNNEKAMRDFLKIMTGSHHMNENERLFDESGFNEKFYDALIFYELETIDVIEPNWQTHYNENHLAYMKDYKKKIPHYILGSCYADERNKYSSGRYYTEEAIDKFPILTIKQEIDRYFEDGHPNHVILTYMLFRLEYRRQFLSYPDLQDFLHPVEKQYVTFLTQINFDSKLCLREEELDKYFSADGPKESLSVLLYELNEFDLIIDNNVEYHNSLPKKDVLILDEYKSIEDAALKQVFKNYLKENKNEIPEDKVKLVAEVLRKISKSNSQELINLRASIANQVLATDNPIENVAKIEKIFVQNNIPTIGKIYSVVELLHPDFAGFDLSESSMVSPVLKSKGTHGKKAVVFSDLVRIALGSNNRSMKKYLENLRKGNKLYQELKQDPNRVLSLEEEKTLKEFIAHLVTLYKRTIVGKNKEVELTGDYLKDLDYLTVLLSPNGGLDYDIADRAVEMFCQFAGIKTLAEAEKYMTDRVATAEKRNRSKTNLYLHEGDFIKGIGGVSHLGHILQNGSLSKEYLGAYSTSDATPLDTDASMIIGASGIPEQAMQGTAASGYGPIWFVLKNDSRFTFTRRSAADPNQQIDEKPDPLKLEAFYTGVCGKDHYGIRTGFATTDIDAIVVEKYDNRIGLEIALNGFYIPVFDKKGELVFTPQQYDELRAKMAGLSYYDCNEYKFSEDLMVPGVLEIAAQLPESREDIIKKRTAILKAIGNVLSKYNLSLKDGFDGDLSNGSAELIDTGSTGRFTNMPGDGDFDFMLKLDRNIIEDPSKLDAIKKDLLAVFGKTGTNEVIGSGDFRLKKVSLPDLPMTVDIDITFEPKTDKVQYSTDEALKDRLNTIRNQDKEKYLLVVANILLAKKLFKKYEVYKPNRGDVPQGGLGGVGIENWVLEHGGSLKAAAEDFLKVAEGKTFEEFRQAYTVWDFGENHLVTRKSIYPHDNFVYNMSEQGYEKMRSVLKAYLQSLKEAKDKHIDNIEEYIGSVLK